MSSVFYLDYELGNDSNDGSNWANAWKTFTAGPTAARIAPGDIIRIAKSPAPTSLGNATWTTGPQPASKSIASVTNGTPIVCTLTNHGYVDGDMIFIYGANTATAANGFWIVTNKTDNTFELYDGWGNASVGNFSQTGFPTVRKINTRCVFLNTAQTMLIDECEGTPSPWTLANSASVAPVDTGSCKSGGYGQQITAPASPATTTLYAYKATGTLNCSSYQRITFWIKNEVVLAANNWKLCLCDDAAGTSIQDTFDIPAITASIGKWIPLTITRRGGGNCYNGVQSVALYSDSAAPTASKYIQLDHISLATTNGLNLQSLISKNSLEQGGEEGWYAIQSIFGRYVILDLAASTAPNSDNMTGYYGSTENVETFKRETIKTTPYQSGTREIDIQDSGSAGNQIQFLGGYNTSDANLCDGETYFDGLNGAGYGLYLNKTYVTINNLNFCRYQNGIHLVESCHGVILNNISNINNNSSYGLYHDGSISNLTINNISNANNNATAGISISSGYAHSGLYIVNIENLNSNQNGFVISGGSGGGYNNIIETINNANGNTSSGINIAMSGGYSNQFVMINNANYNGSTGIILGTDYSVLGVGTIKNNITGLSLAGKYNMITGINHADNNTSYGVSISNDFNTICSLNTTGNGTSSIYATQSYITYLRSWVYTETAMNVLGGSTEIRSWKHQNIANNHWVFFQGSETIQLQSGTVYTEGGLAWKLDPRSNHNIYKPIKLRIAEVAVNANTPVTISVFVKLSHATNVGAKLVVPNYFIGGVNPDDVYKTADTNWERLTMTFTPTDIGVIPVELWGWYVSGTDSIYVDTMSISQV